MAREGNGTRTTGRRTAGGSRAKAQAELSPQEQKAKRRKKKKILRTIYYAIPVLLFICFVVFGILFIKDFREYQVAKKAYKELDAMVEEKGVATVKSLPVAVTEDPDVDIMDIPEAEPFEYPVLDIDYAGLKHVNPDFVGILYVPSLEMRYPVVHSRDNDEYLHKTYDGIPNSAGAIFLDYLADSDMEDRNTFLFGHNMKNGSMFGSLKKFTKDETLAANDPYVYFYTSDCVRKYEIFAIYFSYVGSDAYQNFAGDNGYDEYVEKAKKNSLFVNDEVDLSGRPNILSLSTCSGTEHVRRLLVQSALIGKAAY